MSQYQARRRPPPEDRRPTRRAAPAADDSDVVGMIVRGVIGIVAGLLLMVVFLALVLGLWMLVSS